LRERCLASGQVVRVPKKHCRKKTNTVSGWERRVEVGDLPQDPREHPGDAHKFAVKTTKRTCLVYPPHEHLSDGGRLHCASDICGGSGGGDGGDGWWQCSGGGTI